MNAVKLIQCTLATYKLRWTLSIMQILNSIFLIWKRSKAQFY